MICRISLPNIRYGHLTPPEDSMALREGVFAVGDGITRDPSYDMDFKKKSIEEILQDYPLQAERVSRQIFFVNLSLKLEVRI